jgi:hypothetical protein
MRVAGPIDVRRAFQLINRATWNFVERTLINPSGITITLLAFYDDAVYGCYIGKIGRIAEDELLWSN